MDYPLVNGQPSIPGRYWVFPYSYGAPLMARIDYVTQGATTLVPELHCFDYSPALGDVWFGPIPFPPTPDWNSLASVPEQTS